MDLNINSFTAIQGRENLRGRLIPGFIHNLYHFYESLKIYEDGVVDCWEAVNLDLFAKKLSSGWVTPKVPNGERLWFHHLGSWNVLDGVWTFDLQGFYDHIVHVIESMKFDNRSALPNNPEDRKDPAGYGDGFYGFLKLDTLHYTRTDISVFGDDHIELSNDETPRSITFEELEEMTNAGMLVGQLPEKSRVQLYGLGEFTIGQCHGAVDIQSKVQETRDIIAKINGGPSSGQICRAAYETYLKQPTETNKTALKDAYENVPEHLRVYLLGDMDAKDWPIRMIIYGKDQIKNWSHYIAA
ncbi:MAG: hypothetical protein AAF570_25535, partial [Bacteroidota bacterium]